MTCIFSRWPLRFPPRHDGVFPGRLRFTRRTASAVLAAVTLILSGIPVPAAGSPVSRSGPDRTRLILATATTGGTYYPVGVGIATLVTRQLGGSEGISMTAITSAGSGENIQLLNNREADLAVIQGLWAAMAWRGTGKYRAPQTDLCALTGLWVNVEHFVIQRKFVRTGDISDMRYLRGKRFSIGKRGSGTEVSGRVILEGAGFDPDKDFKLQYLGYTPSANSLRNKRISGMNIPAGPPAGAVTQAFASVGAGNLAILSFTDGQLAAINTRYPVWRRHVIAAGTYPGQKQSVAAIGQSNLLVARRGLSEETAYLILKTVYSRLGDLQRIHQATRELALDRALEGLFLPLHPGAVRFYLESGLEIPARLLPSKR